MKTGCHTFGCKKTRTGILFTQCFLAIILMAGHATLASVAGRTGNRPESRSHTGASIQGQLPAFDFTINAVAAQWRPLHDLAPLEPTTNGLVLRITGSDPYMSGPSRNYPAGKPLWLHVRLRSDAGGTCQVFYYTDHPTEEKSVRFHVPPGEGFEAQVPMPALGLGYSLRLDPPGAAGTCVVQRIWFEERVSYQAPAWIKPQPVDMPENAPVLTQGDLRLIHHPTLLGGFRLEVAGQPFAWGNPQAMAGYLQAGELRWLSLNHMSNGLVQAAKAGEGIVAQAEGLDADGGRWIIRQSFFPGSQGSIDFETEVITDQERDVLYLPMLTLLPGLASFGTNKNQGLLAGVEYLENESSSSEADLKAPAAWRQVVDTLKLTFPLMAIQAENRYAGILWEPAPHFCALFDSPDRQFHSGGHVMSLLFPGSDGQNREENNLLPYRPATLRAGERLRLRASLIGGTSDSVVAAVQKYIRLKGLPAVPDSGYSAREYNDLAAHGWLDSKIRQGNRYRHAWWPGFNPTPAADAALWMLWLAGQVKDPTLAGRLKEAVPLALAEVAPSSYNSAQVGHVRYPAPSLVFGATLENAANAGKNARNILSRFQSDGSFQYVPPANGIDYSRTHWSKEANGLAASLVSGLLESAIFSGNRDLIQEGLRCLRAMNKFKNTVPRGAQTWEIPLHTPDILAAAYLVKAYSLGYQITGDPVFLEHARYWAWTGVPFVYLTAPTPKPIGCYSTIAVLGATGWVAPVWIGQPVQWCGLVYADSLHHLAALDPDGPWKTMGDGIAVAGIQHTWPQSDQERQGLLPDFFHLRAQLSDGPAINPATVLAPASMMFNGPRVYDFQVFPRHTLWAHAPGQIDAVSETASEVRFTVHLWAPSPCWILVNGFRQPPRVKVNGKEIQLNAPHSFQSPEGRLLLHLEKTSTVELIHPAVAGLRIQPLPGRDRMNVCWPLNASDYVLEHRAALQEAVPWLTVSTPFQRVGDDLYVTWNLSNQSGFFRLRRH
ncbi:MAG TPA: hypothetical protein P5186_00025 [Candidatus Paceibacterota bacterium]|nr:hypothetical protein [Verrucomicrobiota bacterium]HRY46411.1 hypothetical protein [Candidatus Paceibacterota bacterium]